MKWPAELLLIRHAESAYNNLKKQKDADPDYRRFRTLLENDPSNPEIQPLAVVLHKKSRARLQRPRYPNHRDGGSASQNDWKRDVGIGS